MDFKTRLDNGWSYLTGWDGEHKSFVCTMWRPLEKNEKVASHNQRHPGGCQFKHVFSSNGPHKTIEEAIQAVLGMIPGDLK